MVADLRTRRSENAKRQWAVRRRREKVCKMVASRVARDGVLHLAGVCFFSASRFNDCGEPIEGRTFGVGYDKPAKDWNVSAIRRELHGK